MGRWHAHAARRLGAKVIAVGDPDLDRARALAGPGTPVFADTQALFDAVVPDVVHLCSPSDTHYDVICTAIAHGTHVFGEKPLASDASETRELFEQAKKAKVSLCPVHQYAFQPALGRAISQRHMTGRSELVEMRFFSAGAAGADPCDFPRIVGDILPHPISIAQRIWPEHLMDQVDWAIAPAGTAGWQVNANIGSVLLRITLSLAARPTEASVSLHGDKGAWEVDLFHGYARFRDGTANRRSKTLRPFSDAFGTLGHASLNMAGRAFRREPAYPGLRNLLAEFYASIAAHSPSPIGDGQAIAVAAIRDRFLSQSIGSGSRRV